jgi:Ca-activated chloride channel homolog
MRWFEIDWPVFWGALLFGMLLYLYSLWRWRRGERAHLLFSSLDSLGEGQSWRVKLAFIPPLCKLMTMGLFLFALADPRWVIEEKGEAPPQPPPLEEESVEEIPIPREGIALYFLLDRSGSMAQEVDLPLQGGGRRRLQRIELLKQLTRKFIQGDEAFELAGRAQDMIGLIGFARVAQVETPLTLDHQSLLQRLEKMRVVRYRQEDGTAIGYGLFKTVNLIAATKHYAEQLNREGRPAYEIKSQVVVLITDGMQNPHPLDQHHELRSISLAKAADYAKEKGVRVYIINVEPAIRFVQFRAAREEQELAANVTGGKYYIADDSATLTEIYREIDQLERSQLPQKFIAKGRVVQNGAPKEPGTILRTESWAPALILSGMATLLIGLLLSATLFRRGI